MHRNAIKICEGTTILQSCLNSVGNSCSILFLFLSFPPVLFDDCVGNEGMAFEVSHPDFQVDEEMNLVARRDVMDSGTVMFIHGVNEHAEDMAQVDIVGALPRSPQTLRVSH